MIQIMYYVVAESGVFYAFKKADYIAFVVNHNVIEVPRGYSQKYRLDTGKRLIPLGRKCCRQLTFS